MHDWPSAAVIFDSRGFQRDDKLNGYNWELPKLPKQTYSNFTLYSNTTKQLISIGGVQSGNHCDEIYALSFDDDDYFNQLLPQ